MANSEKTLEFDQGGATRTLSPVAQQRVILRLTGSGQEALGRDDSYRFNRVLKGDKKEADHELIYKQGAYFLDFKPKDDDEGNAGLLRAVGALDEALLTTQLQASLSGAWTMPEGGPRVGQVTTDWKNTATEVTPAAQGLFEQHRVAFIDAAAKLIEQGIDYEYLQFEV